MKCYDYLRLLYARAGIPYSPATGLPIESQTVSQMVDGIMELPEGTKIYLLAPIVRGHKGEYRKEIAALQKKGFQRLKIDGELYEMDELPTLDKNKKHEIEVVVDRIVISKDLGNRLADSIETALSLSNGLLHVEIIGENKKEKNSPTTLSPDNLMTFSSKFACPVSGFTLPEIRHRSYFPSTAPMAHVPPATDLARNYFLTPI